MAAAIDVALTGVNRLVWLLTLTWVVMAHLAAATAFLLLAWWLQIRPPTAAEVAAYLRSPDTSAVLTATGLTGIAIVGAYAWAIRKATRWVHAGLRRYWLKGL